MLVEHSDEAQPHEQPAEEVDGGESENNVPSQAPKQSQGKNEDGDSREGLKQEPEPGDPGGFSVGVVVDSHVGFDLSVCPRREMISVDPLPAPARPPQPGRKA